MDKRCRTGDYEADLVLGKNHKMAILTMNDRATGYTFLELLQGKSAEEVQLKIERIITENQLTIHTLTTDNGKEIEDSTRPNRENIKHRVNLQSTRSCQSVYILIITLLILTTAGNEAQMRTITNC